MTNLVTLVPMDHYRMFKLSLCWNFLRAEFVCPQKKRKYDLFGTNRCVSSVRCFCKWYFSSFYNKKRPVWWQNIYPDRANQWNIQLLILKDYLLAYYTISSKNTNKIYVWLIFRNYLGTVITGLMMNEAIYLGKCISSNNPFTTSYFKWANPNNFFQLICSFRF